MKIYFCRLCGNLVTMLDDSGVNPVCCGEDMILLSPSSHDGIAEKHVPVIEVKDNNVVVKVGELPHPMNSEHYITWVMLVTSKGFHVINLAPPDTPVACFHLCEGEKPIEAYEYCNLHGLWYKKL